MKRILLAYTLSALCLLPAFAGGGEGALPISYVNPFIGTTNFGTTNPGAVCPNGMMSVVGLVSIPSGALSGRLLAVPAMIRIWFPPL